jgi:hypothetical protein
MENPLLASGEVVIDGENAGGDAAGGRGIHGGTSGGAGDVGEEGVLTSAAD